MTHEPVSVYEAVRAEIAEIAKNDPALARGGVAASALRLAELMDDSDIRPTAAAECARALKANLDTLRDLSPPAQTEDNVHDLAGRASLKLAGGATS